MKALLAKRAPVSLFSLGLRNSHFRRRETGMTPRVRTLAILITLAAGLAAGRIASGAVIERETEFVRAGRLRAISAPKAPSSS